MARKMDSWPAYWLASRCSRELRLLDEVPILKLILSYWRALLGRLTLELYINTGRETLRNWTKIMSERAHLDRRKSQVWALDVIESGCKILMRYTLEEDGHEERLELSGSRGLFT